MTWERSPWCKPAGAAYPWPRYLTCDLMAGAWVMRLFPGGAVERVSKIAKHRATSNMTAVGYFIISTPYMSGSTTLLVATGFWVLAWRPCKCMRDRKRLEQRLCHDSPVHRGCSLLAGVSLTATGSCGKWMAQIGLANALQRARGRREILRQITRL